VILNLATKFLASKFSGYLALGLVIAAGSLYWYIDELRDDYAALKRECLVSISPEVEEISQELKQIRIEEYDRLRKILADAKHPCLDWVYDPNNQTREGTIVSDAKARK
jgi:hypothetical protein